MKKAIAFMVGVAVLAGLLAGTGCKSRDVKKLALGMGPVPVTNTNACNVAGTYVVNGSGCPEGLEGDTYGASGPFRECDFSGTQRVYEMIVTSPTTFAAYAVTWDGDIGISLRRNCNPGSSESDVVDCNCCQYEGEYYAAIYPMPLSAGTYYLVIDTLEGPTEFEFGFCDDLRL